MKQNIISLHGSYFGKNYGDILLVNLFAKWIRSLCPNTVINMPLGGRSTAPDLDYDTTGIMNLFRSKALIFCGGGYFGEKPKHYQRWAMRNFKRHGIIGLLAVLFHIPFAIIGVEFGPISSCWFRKFCIWLAKHASVVVVRNEESLKFLGDNGISNAVLSADAVLTLPDIIKPNNNNDIEVPNIVIHMDTITASYLDTTLLLIKSITDAAKETFSDYNLIIISDGTNRWFDQPFFAPVLTYLSQNKINYKTYPYETCQKLIDIINSSQYIITTKLHVGITSLALNKRVFSFWTHSKTPRLHKMANNERYCLEYKNINEETKRMLKSFFLVSPYELNQDLKDKAQRNRIELNKFLHTLHTL
ncbi:MAG: polysaccharide pyruvyl transferase family protein [Bacteroidaceae bacterium]|nr:polysaccharide pyruvyl transferase family protein [Bacteroidaceae bacterium]